MTIGEPLPTDGNGGDRLYRTGIIATMMAELGHEVVWWSSTFDHIRKRRRFSDDTTLRLTSGVVLKLIHGYGYSRNISIRRIFDHAILARKFTLQAGGMARPDVILCSLPPLDLSMSVSRYGKANGIPVIIDVRDLWPDIFLELIPQWGRTLFGHVLAPMWRQARISCRNAFAITGNCPGFVEWGLRHAGRSGTDLDRYFPFGYTTLKLSEAEQEHAMRFWSKYGLREEDSEFTVCFFGTFGKQFDLETVIDAAMMLETEGARVRFVLCGTGERLEGLKTRARGSNAVIFPGWVGRDLIWTLMALSDVGIAPYRNHPGFVNNLPNKPIEYLAGGLPIISGLHGYLECLLDRYQCGLSYAPGDAKALRDVVMRLMDDRKFLKGISINARRLFSEKFDANKVYGEIILYLQEVVSVYSTRTHSYLET